MKKVGIIGCGNMGSALARGILKKPSSGFRVGVYDIEKRKVSALAKEFKGLHKFSSLQALWDASDILIVAVKPQNIEGVLEKIKGPCAKLIISIAAGITTRFIEKRVGRAAVIRVMPNLAARVEKSISALAKGRYANLSHLKIASKIFSCVGKTLVVNERKIDAVTAVSGSGPGYLFYFLSLIEEAAQKAGLKKKEAEILVKEMFLGSARVAEEAREDSLSLYLQVASKGGTTEAAVSFWQKHKLKNLIRKGINKALKRAKELSK